jgi:L,D-transpeptidase ErfK/SrfK
MVVLLTLAPAWAGTAQLPPVIGDEPEMTVSSGDTLFHVARSHGLGMEHVAWANHLPVRDRLEPETTLILPMRHILPANPPRDGLVLNLAERGVYLFRHGAFEKFYPVAVGMPGWYTPRGNFKIATRTKNPVWLPPAWAGLGEIAVLPGPHNPLGDRWMGLSVHGVGMHATNMPRSIGSAASHGCIRMYPEGARDLFDRVRVGMPIRIEYQTARLGVDEATGDLYLSVWPDVYGFESPLHAARRLVKAAGLEERVREASLREVVAQRAGRPLCIARAVMRQTSP